MNVSLTPQLEAMVEQKVRTGLYASANEVVREALRLLDERDRVIAADQAKLQADVRAGLMQIDEGGGIPFESGGTHRLASQVKADGRKRIRGSRGEPGGRAR